MLFHSKSLTSALVAMVTLSIAVSASLDPIEQHLVARDSTPFQPSREATGKLATPVNLGKTSISPQAIFKLTGQDLHSDLPVKGSASSPLEASAIAVAGKLSPVAPVDDVDDVKRAHCYLGHETVNIKRVRYTMRVQLDSDESGATTVAEADSVRGAVVKATSGLYSNSNPDKGSCAKTLARHGEVCANRPYIVPNSMLPAPEPGSQEPAYHAGPLITRRSSSAKIQPLEDWNRADEAANLIFKRDSTTSPSNPDPSGPGYQTDATVSSAHTAITNPLGSVCIDTVKRDKQVTKIVPTKTSHASSPRRAPLHFELVRSDEKSDTWSQIIYNAHGTPIDTTHLSLTSQMSFWRAEYYCADCNEGHRAHTVVYENVEVEVDEEGEYAVPEIRCDGQAKSTDVEQRDKSRYADKNASGVEYTGAIYAIDRVSLGQFEGKGKGGVASYTHGHAELLSGSTDAQAAQKQRVEESKTPGEPNKHAKKLPDPVTKRDVVVAEDGPIF